LQAGDLIAQGDERLGQRLKAAVIVHVLLDLGGLVRRHALRELFAVKEALQNIIGPARRAGPRGTGFEKLFAQGAPPEAVDGLHLLENGLPLLKKIIKIMLHGIKCIYIDTFFNRKVPALPVFFFGVTRRSRTR
jgi:hypothetical protein